MSQGNLQHFRGIRSYAFLIWLIVGMATLLILLITSLAGVAGMAGLAKIGNVGIVLVWFIAGYVVVGRFMAIEQRKPTLSEASSVGVWSLLTFFMIAAAILVVVVCFMIFGLASGAEMGGGGGAGGEGKDAVKAAEAAGGLNKVFKPLMGFFGALTWIYLVPLLSFAIFPLFQRPPTLEAEV